MSLAAGKLRHKLTFLSLLTLQDADGNPVESWVEAFQTRGAFEPSSVREFTAAQSVQSQIMANVTIRYRSDVNPRMRIRHRGRDYGIEGELADKISGLEYLTLPVRAVLDPTPAEEVTIIDGGGDPL